MKLTRERLTAVFAEAAKEVGPDERGITDTSDDADRGGGYVGRYDSRFEAERALAAALKALREREANDAR